MRMVASGMLPIELKAATLRDARLEEELHDLEAESDQLGRLIGRFRLATALRGMRRERAQATRERAAAAAAARDTPLLDEMAASVRRRRWIATEVLATARALSAHRAEHTALTRRLRQLRR